MGCCDPKAQRLILILQLYSRLCQREVCCVSVGILQGARINIQLMQACDAIGDC
ncbi:hypothetical protein JCM14036_25110 [Desulfotomaculum defluvii]